MSSRLNRLRGLLGELEVDALLVTNGTNVRYLCGFESSNAQLLVDPDDRSLLGVHVIGTGATELVHIGQAVMAQGPGGLDFLVTAVFNYPTFAESYKVAALDAANRIRAQR